MRFLYTLAYMYSPYIYANIYIIFYMLHICTFRMGRHFVVSNKIWPPIRLGIRPQLLKTEHDRRLAGGVATVINRELWSVPVIHSHRPLCRRRRSRSRRASVFRSAKLLLCFLPRSAVLQRDLSIGLPSVTRWQCVKINDHRVMWFSATGSQENLVF